MPHSKNNSRARWVLLNPGPVNVTEKVRRALLLPDICHREPEFSRLLQGIRKKLLKIFGVQNSHAAVILTGSGTLAVEAMLSSYAGPDKKILVLSNGVYGERMTTMLKACGAPHAVLTAPIGQFPSEEAIENLLRTDREIKAIAMVHHETSSGMLNPLKEIGQLAEKHGKTFLVDAVSSLGAEEVKFREWSIDFAAGSAGKCLHAFPGISFVLISKNKIDSLKRKNLSSVYLDLYSILKSEASGSPPFTPAVQLFYAFDAALDELSFEGLKNRIRSYQKKNRLLEEGFQKRGLRFLVEKKYRSHVLTALWLPPGISYARLHDSLKKERFVIYEGQSKLKGQIFRISNLGAIPDAELRRFLAVLKKILYRPSSHPRNQVVRKDGVFVPSGRRVTRRRAPTGAEALGPSTRGKPKRQDPSAKAIILAAGVGERFGKRTQARPKCLIPLANSGDTLLKRYFDSFREVGIRDVVIVVGYLKEQIQNACRKWARGLRVRFIENKNYRQGSVVSLHAAAKELNADVLVMDADVYFPTEALRRLVDSKEKSAFLLDANSKSTGEEMMVQARNGRIVRISKSVSPALETAGEATGIVKLQKSDARALKKSLSKIIRQGRVDAEYEESYNELMKTRRLGWVAMRGLFWCEMDFEEDLEKIRTNALPARRAGSPRMNRSRSSRLRSGWRRSSPPSLPIPASYR